MKDWTYFALDERVCLAPCAPFIMLPMFESAARVPAGANPWLLKPIRSFEKSARHSVSFPSCLSRARADSSSIKNDKRTFFHPARDVTPTRCVFIHRSCRFFSFASPASSRYMYTSLSVSQVASHRIARNGVPLCDIHSFIHGITHNARERRWNHFTKQIRTALVVVVSSVALGGRWSFVDARRTAVGSSIDVHSKRTTSCSRGRETRRFVPLLEFDRTFGMVVLYGYLVWVDCVRPGCLKFLDVQSLVMCELASRKR